jgi:hypothetical protein
MSDQVSDLRRRLDPQDRALLDQLSAAQSQFSTLKLGGPGKTPPAEYAANISRLEAEAVGAMLPQAKILTQGTATESAIKQLSGPRVLHVATHGFFLPDQPEIEVRDGDKSEVKRRLENPLLRSGLLLAGANGLRGEGENDGVLTAFEAAGLDLWGTQLVYSRPARPVWAKSRMVMVSMG